MGAHRAEVRRQLTRGGGVTGHVDFATRRQVDAAEFALRVAVAVEVGPGHRLGGQEERVLRLREADRARLHVLAEARLEGGLLVAEQVVHDADARRDALPGRHVDRAERAGLNEATGGRHFFRNTVREEFPARAVVDREALQRPRVLREDTEVGLQLVRVVHRRVQDGDLERHTVVELRAEVAVRQTRVAVGAPVVLDTDLHVVRTGHVRQRRGKREAVGIHAVDAGAGAPRGATGRVGAVDRREPLRRAALLLEAFLIDGVVALEVRREAGLEEDLARDGRGELDRAGRVDRRVPDDASGTRVEAGGHGGATVLQQAVVVDSQLVLLRHLPHDARLHRTDALRIDALLAGRGRGDEIRARAFRTVEGVGGQGVEDEVTGRREVPDLVLLDRAAEGAFDVGQLADAVRRADAALDQVVVDVVALERLVLVAEEQAARHDVAAVAGNLVQTDAAARHVSRGAGGGVDHFLRHRAVEVVLHRAVHVEAVHEEAVDLHGRLRSARAVRRHVGLLHGLRATDVRRVQRDARDELAHALDGAARRDRVQRFAVQHLRLRRALHVDRRRRTGHRQRLFERADLEFGVDRHREVRRERNALTLHRRETFERERQRVGARSQIDQTITAVRVGDDRTGLFDECVACRFNGHAGQNCTRSVLDHASKCALGVRRDGREAQSGQRHEQRFPNGTNLHSRSSRFLRICGPGTSFTQNAAKKYRRG